VGSIIWATGLRFDLGPLKLPVVAGDGFPIQERGVSAYPGLYFAGMNWMPTLVTGFIFGFGKQVQYVADHIAARPV
jgi:putative flavoprotein involved in K+ transport